MKLGGEYRLRNINLHHWRKLVKERRLDSDAVIHRLMTWPDGYAIMSQKSNNAWSPRASRTPSFRDWLMHSDCGHAPAGKS